MNRISILILSCCLCTACTREDEFSTSSPEALALYREGVKQHHQFYYPEARSLLDSAVALDSSFALAWGRLASLHFELRDEEAAWRAIEQANKNISGVSLKERLYINLWNQMILFSNEGTKAVVDSIIALFPGDAEAYVIKGTYFEHEASLDSAISYYHRGAALDSGFTRAIMHLGYAYSASGDQEKALNYMQKYIRRAPDLADPRASYADLLLRSGRYNEALDQYNRSLELKPDYWYAINQIGYIYRILGRLRDAEAQFLQGFSILLGTDKNKAAEATILGDLNLARGEYRRAESEFRAALAVDSTSFDAAYGLVYSLALQKRFEEAGIVSGEIHAELKRRNLTGTQIMLGFHLMRSRVLLEKGEAEEARRESEAALRHATNVSRRAVLQQAAEISFRQREFERAIMECEEALAVNPNSPSTLLILAKIYHAKGDLQMTREIGSRLLTLWSNADDDFKDLREIKHLLRPGPAVTS